MKKNEEVYVIQNFLMHKELLLHKKTKADLNRDIGELKVSIVELKSSLKRKQQYKKLVLWMANKLCSMYFFLTLFQVSARLWNSSEHSNPETIANLKLMIAAPF